MLVRFGLIGGGVMGESLLSRLVAQGIYPPDNIMVSEPLPQRQDFLRETYGVQVVGDNHLVAAATEVVLLAIKPQVFEQVAADCREVGGALVISILAGVSLARLEAAFGDRPVIRAMPNTPATIGAGMTALAPGRQVQGEHLQQAHRIFEAVGQVVTVSEDLMDGVTGLSGSGPAFVALLVEALADGGVGAGLPRSLAAQLALQTVLGTAQLLQEKGIHPAQLKDQVTSPGGTTIAGVAVLEQQGFRSAAIEAVKAAAQRSRELGQRV